MEFTLNGAARRIETDPELPLLWLLRDVLQLMGTKFGCGVAQCGACTVHLDDVPVRACVIPASAIAGKAVTTIEGLQDHPVQAAWVEAQVPQCGYCQSGMIMCAVALLREKPAPTPAEIDSAMTNLCRCGTYPRIRRAIALAAAK